MDEGKVVMFISRVTQLFSILSLLIIPWSDGLANEETEASTTQPINNIEISADKTKAKRKTPPDRTDITDKSMSLDPIPVTPSLGSIPITPSLDPYDQTSGQDDCWIYINEKGETHCLKNE